MSPDTFKIMDPEESFINRTPINAITISEHDRIKFINLVTNEESLEIELSTKTKITLKYITDKDTIEGLEIKKFVRRSKYSTYGREPDEHINLSGITISQLVSLVNIITQLNISELSQNRISLSSLESEKIDNRIFELFKSLQSNPEFLQKLHEGELLQEDILMSVQLAKKRSELTIFEESLNSNKLENFYQKWFEQNPWIFGTDFIDFLDDSRIDTKNISDLLLKAYDGFIDILEIKRPSEKLSFWQKEKDHDNYIPSNELVKAITQTINYIYEIEGESDSKKFSEDHANLSVVKPRAILIFGRSNDWNEGQKLAFRILNSSYHNLSILTYDHVLSRGKQILGLN